MWLLTCDGDLFGHKPIWLRPGSGHLLGRTSGRAEGGEVVRYINHKSVSRKHATIHATQTKAGDSARLYSRSEIKLTDGSKIGTFIDGEKICGTTKILDKTEHTIKLGNYEHLFHLKWQPVVLTFTSLSKKEKANSDPLEAQRKKLEHTDIKLITEYMSSQTTHVVGKKRNTAPGLQALLQGRWLLAQSFVDAVALATAKPGQDASGNDRPCPLEENFETSWPSEEDHILPTAGERDPKPNEYLKPNSQRAELFDHFTFIFLSQTQFDNLMPVVTSGGGKALLWEVEVGKSRPENLISYVREVAGAKGNGEFRLSQHTGKGGVVLVRLENKEKEWTAEYLKTVEAVLEQRSIEQNQFLSAILNVDASELRRSLVRESQSQVPAAPSPSLNGGSGRRSSRTREQSQPDPRNTVENQAPTSTQNQTPPDTQQQAEQTENMEPVARKKTRRIVTQSRFKTFGEVDASQFSRPGSDSPEPEQAAPDEQSMQVDEPSEHEPSQRPSRKRPAPVDADEEEKAAMDQMLPGAAAMKKRRLQTKANGGSADDSSNATPEPEKSAKATKNTTGKKQMEMDVGAELKKKRDADEEEDRRKEQENREALEGDIEGITAKVVSDMIIREAPSRNEPSDPDNRWFGRKNFKGFKRRGQDHNRPRLPRVIVETEEVPRRGHGIGEEYWLNSSTASKSQGSKSKSQHTQSQTQTSISHMNGDDDPTRFRRRIQNSRLEDEEATQAMEDFPDEMAGLGRSAGSASRTGRNATPTQTMGLESQKRATTTTGKRSAPQQAGPAAKRVKPSASASSRQTTAVVDDDDDDGIKFRRKRR